MLGIPKPIKRIREYHIAFSVEDYVCYMQETDINRICKLLSHKKKIDIKNSICKHGFMIVNPVELKILERHYVFTVLKVKGRD